MISISSACTCEYDSGVYFSTALISSGSHSLRSIRVDDFEN